MEFNFLYYFGVSNEKRCKNVSFVNPKEGVEGHHHKNLCLLNPYIQFVRRGLGGPHGFPLLEVQSLKHRFKPLLLHAFIFGALIHSRISNQEFFVSQWNESECVFHTFLFKCEKWRVPLDLKCINVDCHHSMIIETPVLIRHHMTYKPYFISDSHTIRRPTETFENYRSR